MSSFNVCMSRRLFHLAVNVPFKGKEKDVVTEPGPGRRVRHCGNSLSVGKEEEEEENLGDCGTLTTFILFMLRMPKAARIYRVAKAVIDKNHVTYLQPLHLVYVDWI